MENPGDLAATLAAPSSYKQMLIEERKRRLELEEEVACMGSELGEFNPLLIDLRIL